MRIPVLVIYAAAIFYLVYVHCVYTYVCMCTQTELHYMESGNLEFKKGPDPQRLKSDHTVQYGELADTQKYTSIL